nr:MFS transporter [Ectobacillus ponti]
MVINVTGSSFLWPFNSIYMHDHLGQSLSVAGTVLMLNSLTGVFGNLIGGIMFDKWGGYKAILSGIFITLAAVAGLVLHHEWPAYVVWMAVIGFGSGMVFPSMYAMIGAVWPEGGRRAFSAMYVAQNMGVAVGSALGGLVASYKIEYIFAANLMLYLVFLFIALSGFRGIQAMPEKKAKEKQRGWKLTPSMQALLMLSTGYMFAWMAYTQWQATISTYMQSLHISLKSYSLLWTINGAMIVLAQPFITWLVQKLKWTLKQQVLAGTLIFIASFLIVAQAEQFSMFLAAMVVLTIGEMFVWPAVPTIANTLAPEGKIGFYQGLVNSAATGGRMFGPVLGGIIADVYSMHVLFFVMMAMLVVSMAVMGVYDQKLKAKQADRHVAM